MVCAFDSISARQSTVVGSSARLAADEALQAREPAIRLSLLAHEVVARLIRAHSAIRPQPGAANTDAMFIAASYFASLDSDSNGAFKERYYARYGERAPTLNSLSQSVYEGFVYLNRLAGSAVRLPRPTLDGVRAGRRHAAFDARVDPIFLGEVEGLNIRVVETLADAAA